MATDSDTRSDSVLQPCPACPICGADATWETALTANVGGKEVVYGQCSECSCTAEYHDWLLAVSRWWRPIDAAPEMRSVLLWADTSTPEFPNWRMGSGYFSTGAGAWIWEGETVKVWAHPPTHWMPLPDPPTPETRNA